MPVDAERDTHRRGDILRRMFYVFSAFGLRELLMAIFMIYLARLHLVSYGHFIVALSLAGMVRFLSEYGLNQHLVTRLTDRHENPAAPFAEINSLKLTFMAAGLLVLLAFCRWQGYDASLSAMVLVLGAAAGIDSLAGSCFVVCQVQGRQDAEGRIKAFAAITGVGYALVLLLLGAPAPAIAAFWLVESLIKLGLGLGFVMRRLHVQLVTPAAAHVRDSLWRSLPFILMALATSVYNRTSVLFLQRLAGPEAVAQFSVSWELVAGIAGMVSSLLIGSIFFPLLSRLRNTNPDGFILLARSASRWLLALAVPLSFLLAVESDRVIPLLYGPQYTDSIWIQRYLVLILPIGFVHNLAATLMISARREHLLLGFYLAGLLVNLALCAALIGPHPLGGAVAAILITRAVVAVMTMGFGIAAYRFLPWCDLGVLLLVAAIGAGLYAGTIRLLPREAAELLALLPVAALAWTWWFATRPVGCARA